MDNQRLKSLDSLRGIACLIVLIAHIVSTNSVFGIYASGCGKIGVWCFMILSGFLTFLPYAQGKQVVSNGKIKYITNYYKKKINKLYPTYMIGLIFALVIGFLNDFHSVAKHLLCIEGVGHFWYMPVVIKFYLIAPFMLILLECITEKNFVILILLLTIIFSIVFPFTTYIENSIHLYWYLPIFLIGCLLAFVYARIMLNHNKIPRGVIVVAVLTIILLTPKMREVLWNIEPSGWLQNKYLVFAVIWSVIILTILTDEKLSDFLSNCKILQFVGKLSYGVYLIHYLVMWKVIQYTNNTFWVSLIVTLVSVLFAQILNCIGVRIRGQVNQFAIRHHNI